MDLTVTAEEWKDLLAEFSEIWQALIFVAMLIAFMYIIKIVRNIITPFDDDEEVPSEEEKEKGEQKWKRKIEKEKMRAGGEQQITGRGGKVGRGRRGGGWIGRGCPTTGG